MHLSRHDQKHEPGREVVPPPEELAGSHPRRFTMVAATSADLVKQAQRLRYQVYCIEHSFEDPASFPDGLECDEFDPSAIHGLLYDKIHRALAGTVRLILPNPQRPLTSLPIQSLCRHPLPHDLRLLRKGSAEISRFAISREYRWAPRGHLSGEECGERCRGGAPEEEFLTSTLLELVKGLVQMSFEHGISEWFALMEPALLRLLARFAIHFTPLGPLVDYHGRRQPSHVNLSAMLERVHQERPDVWQVITCTGYRPGSA